MKSYAKKYLMRNWLKQVIHKSSKTISYEYIYIIYMLILRVIRINVVHCPFSRVCNKVATKINYVLDHHEFVCQNLNWCRQPNRQPIVYKLFVELSICDKKTTVVCTVVHALTALHLHHRDITSKELRS